MASGTFAATAACVFAVLSLCIVTAAAQSATPAGRPHIDFVVTAPNYNGTDVAAGIADWLRFQTSLRTYGTAINGTAVTMYDFTTVGTTYSMNVSLYAIGPDNVEMYTAMVALKQALDSASVLSSAAYTTVSTRVIENPATTVHYEVDPMSVVYQNQISPTYTIRLSASPRIGKNVTFYISPVAGTVRFNTSKVVIPYPRLTGNFFAYAGPSVTTSGVAFGSIIGGSDTPSRYVQGSSVATEVMTVRQLETIQVTPVSSTQRLYTNRVSPAFTINVPTHRDSNFELVVAVQISPSSGLTATPSNVTLTAPNSPQTFTVRGNPGVYTISYLVGHVYYDVFGRVIGRSNPDFKQIVTTSTITVSSTMNASSSSIPDAYLVNPVTSSDYGGAYSQEIPFSIEQDPVPGTVLTVTPSSTSTIEFSPASISFFPGGIRQYTFRYRAHAIGVHTINFALSGSGAGDYFLRAPSRRWIVHGRNTKCLTRHSSAPCFSMPGCTWNALKSVCINGTLPIAVDRIPLLYNQEESIPLNFTLPTPVRTTVRVTFQAASRLSFSPSTVLLTAGQTTAQFTVTGTLNSDDLGQVQQYFQLRLSGDSANMYDEQRAYVFLRPKVKCTVTPPTNGFFVKTLSDYFTLECDTSPETEVIFTPASTLSGIVFIAEFPDARGSDKLYFSPGQTSARFLANSTNSLKGTVTLSMAITGVNAPRYETIAATTFRVIESGLVNVPPSFHMTAYERSEELHLDLSVPPPSVLNVTIRVFSNDSLPGSVNITITPSVITFNQTTRGSFTVFANGVGWYYLTFAISGASVANYIDPASTRVPFEVKDPLSGRAFDSRLRAGFLGHRKQCRVSVGRESVRFRGQAPVDRADEFCQLYPNKLVYPNETYNCKQHLSEERCRNALATLGHACAWHEEQCQFFPVMEGNILSYAYGSGYTVFLSLAGEIWTVGKTLYGQLGHYNTTIDKVPMSESIAVVAAGSSHTMALSYSGRVYTWGANQNGQLGLNTRTQHLDVPTEVTFPRGENITCLSAGVLHNAALSQSGRLFMWGSNQYGQLGTSAQYRGYANGPIALGRDLFNGDAVVAVTLGEYHSMAATENGAYTWGSNTMGQLGRAGYDSYEPKTPVLWVRDRWTTAPSYASYLLGRDNC
jgi:hypothetical protein